MAWFRRGWRKPDIPRVDVGTYVDPPDRPAPPIEDLVDEAQLIADQAVRLALTNALLLRALRDDRQYSQTEMTALAHDEFDRIAAEADADAVRKPDRRYRDDDSERQARRKAVGTRLAKRLRESATDDERLQELIDRARESALDEILGAYVSANRRHRALDPEERARRRAMVALDLQDLRPGY